MIAGPLFVFAAAFIALVLLGIPIAFALGAAGIIGLALAGTPLETIVHQVQYVMELLMAIPPLVLIGVLMDRGAMTARLFRLAQAVAGSSRSGLAMAAVIAEFLSAGFSSYRLTGVSAVGRLFIGSMTSAGYSAEKAGSLAAAISAMRFLMPASIVLFVVAYMSGVSVVTAMAGAFLPAALFAFVIAVGAAIAMPRGEIAAARAVPRPDLGESVLGALIPLGLPGIVIGGILAGRFTPAEAAAVGACCALVAEFVVYRELQWRDFPQVLIESVVVSAGVCFLVGVIWVAIAGELAVSELATAAAKALSAPMLVLSVIAVLCILLATVLDGLPGTILLAPFLASAASGIGVEGSQASIVIAAATAIGVFMAPTGTVLRNSCELANVEMNRVIGPTVPYLVLFLLALMIVIAFPWLTGALPHWLFGAT